MDGPFARCRGARKSDSFAATCGFVRGPGPVAGDDAEHVGFVGVHVLRPDSADAHPARPRRRCPGHRTARVAPSGRGSCASRWTAPTCNRPDRVVLAAPASSTAVTGVLCHPGHVAALAPTIDRTALDLSTRPPRPATNRPGPAIADAAASRGNSLTASTARDRRPTRRITAMIITLYQR